MGRGAKDGGLRRAHRQRCCTAPSARRWNLAYASGSRNPQLTFLVGCDLRLQLRKAGSADPETRSTEPHDQCWTPYMCGLATGWLAPTPSSGPLTVRWRGSERRQSSMPCRCAAALLTPPWGPCTDCLRSGSGSRARAGWWATGTCACVAERAFVRAQEYGPGAEASYHTSAPALSRGRKQTFQLRRTALHMRQTVHHCGATAGVAGVAQSSPPCKTARPAQ